MRDSEGGTTRGRQAKSVAATALVVLLAACKAASTSSPSPTIVDSVGAHSTTPSVLSASVAPTAGDAPTGSSGSGACEGARVDGRIVFSTEDDVFSVNADGSDVRQVTKAAEHEFDPTWSPDGGRIAFRVDQPSSADIYLINADGTDSHKLVTGLSPSWSPDGKRIAYADAAGMISTIKPNGSDARPVPGTYQGEYPSWSPDGDRLVYSTGSNPHLIFVVKLDGTDRRQLTDGLAEDWQVDWSPDGTRIAFASNRNSTAGDVYTMNADGTEQSRLTSDGGFTPSWSPDGRSLIYSNGELRVVSPETHCAWGIPTPGISGAMMPDWIP